MRQPSSRGNLHSDVAVLAHWGRHQRRRATYCGGVRPNGDFDLYFSESGLTTTHSALFFYYGKESDVSRVP
jgi:hypothetical protein